MKKTTKIIFSIVAMLLICFIGNAQTDTTAITDPLFEGNEVQETLLPSIFNLLGSVGVKVTPFAGLISFLVMFIIRRIEKKRAKIKIATKIRDIVASTPVSQPHDTKLTNLADKLEGIINYPKH